jgi:hypothetical protein
VNAVSPPAETSLLMKLPIARSNSVRIAFIGSVCITLACLAWFLQLRSSGSFQGLSLIFIVLFTYFDYHAAMGALLILLGAMFLSGSPLIKGVLRRVGEKPGLVAIATAIVLSAGALLAYRNHPLAMDEYAPFLQSQAFAAGRLTGQFPAEYLDWLIPPSFQNYFVLVSPKTGDVVSAYWPSFALLLTPFTLLGIPWACNPVLSALTVLVIHRLTMRLFKDDVEAAGLAVLLTVASPVFFANGISYYSMTAHMLANGVFALLMLDPTPRRLILAGLVGSVALTLHNPVPHLLFAAPWGIWLATRPNAVRNLLCIGIGYLPLSLLLGLGWFDFQSDLMAQGNTGSRLGSAFGWPNETVLLARTMGVAKIWLWAVPGLVLLAAAGAWKWREDARVKLLVASAVLTLIGYMFVPADQGHGWGYRYFHSAWLALPLLGAAFLARPAEPAGPQAPTPVDTDLRSFVVAAALATLALGVPQRALQMSELMGNHLDQLPHYSGTEPRVVIVDTANSFYGLDLVQNHAFLKDEVTILLSQGPAANAKVMASFKPDYRLVYTDARGEVWSNAAPVASAQAQ